MNLAFAFPLGQFYIWAGLGLCLVVIAVFLLRRQDGRRRIRLDRFIEAKLAPRLLGGWDQRKRRPLGWLTAIGIAAALLALAQPHWGNAWREVNRRSHDIMICLDVSESMLATNPVPNRLERAKQKIAALVEESYGDRFGLVAFSGAAELMCPLTLDHGYFRNVLNAVDTDSIGLEGTDIAAALEVAMATYIDQERPEDVDSRAILVISDGEEVSGNAVALAEKVADQARVFVIGVGDPRGAQVEYVRRIGRGAAEPETHFSVLDEGRLQRIALTGKGGYIRSTADESDIREMRALIEQMFARDVGGEIREQLVNRYQWPLAIAIACFMAEGLWLVWMPVMAWSRRRRTENEEAAHA